MPYTQTPPTRTHTHTHMHRAWKINFCFAQYYIQTDNAAAPSACTTSVESLPDRFFFFFLFIDVLCAQVFLLFSVSCQLSNNQKGAEKQNKRKCVCVIFVVVFFLPPVECVSESGVICVVVENQLEVARNLFVLFFNAVVYCAGAFLFIFLLGGFSCCRRHFPSRLLPSRPHHM